MYVGGGSGCCFSSLSMTQSDILHPTTTSLSLRYFPSPPLSSRNPGFWHRLVSLEARASLRQTMFTIIYLPIVYLVFGTILGECIYMMLNNVIGRCLDG